MLPVSLLDFERQFLRALRKKQGETAVPIFFEKAELVKTTEAAFQHYQTELNLNFETLLKKAFPVVYAVVGQAFFHWLAKTFIAEFPAKQPDFSRYGLYFPEFIRTLSQLEACPYLPDVARLDWAWHTAYFAADDEPFDFEKLGMLPAMLQADIVFHLPKNASLIDSVYPIHQIWNANQSDFKGEQNVDLAAPGETVLVWREAGQPAMVLLNTEQKEVMRLFAASLPFAEICERLAAIEGMPSAAAILPYYIEKKWLASFSLPQ